MKTLMIMLLLCTGVASAAERPWLRRASAAFTCAASTADYTTTLRVIGAGGVETNPLLLNKGVIDTKRFLGVKIGVCAVVMVVEEIPHLVHAKNADQWDKSLIPVNLITGSMFGGIALHNRGVYVEQKRLNNAAASGILR